MANKVHGRGTVYNPLVTDELLAQVNPENIQLKKDFLAYLRSIDRAKTTLDSYDHDLDYFFCWNVLYNGNKFFVDMNKREFARFQDFGLNENGWSSARVTRVKSTLSSLSNYIYNICDDLYESYKPVVRRIESPVNEPVREKTVLSDDEVNELLTIINANPIYVKAVNPFFANGYIEAEFRCSKANCEMLENHNYRLSFNLVQKKKVSGQ